MTNAAEIQAQLVEVANEYNRLQRQLESKTQRLDALLAANGRAGDFPVDFLGAIPRVYALTASFDVLDPDNTVYEGIEPVEADFTVDRGTIFRAAYMESVVRAVGTATDPYTSPAVASAVQATLPWNSRLRVFDYTLFLRDTGTDREWQDRPQPSMFGGGSYVGPLWFPRRCILSGGTTVYGLIQPTVIAPIAEYFNGDSGTVQSYTVQINIWGHQVPDTSAS